MKRTRKTHGHWVGGRASKVWSTHRGMLTRCCTPTSWAYVRYGGRGITVCSRWHHGEGGLSGFECFLLDMGSPPSKRHSIDRIDNDKGYSPENCRWATKKEQSNNRGNNVFISAFGESLTVNQWADRVGVTESCIRYRLFKKGMSPEMAISSPSLRPRKPKS